MQRKMVMARSASKNPTELELAVLTVLWEGGSMTGGQVRDALAQERELTYQAVMTVLGIMESKRYVSRKKKAGSFEYRARVTRKTTAKRMMGDLVERLFKGSAKAAMINLLETSDLSEDELRELRREVERSREAERNRKGK